MYRITDKKIPKTLFKYRDWGIEYHRRLVSKQEIYFAKASEFNDPYEGTVRERWDLMTYDECLKKNEELFSLIFKNKPKEQISEYAKRITDEKKFWHPDNVKKESNESLQNWDRILGLFSLSETYDNILMWSHYANNHSGFVVGFNTEKLCNDYGFGYTEPIVYQDNFPIPNSSDDSTKRFHKKFFHKSKVWEYEKEWRISLNHIQNRVVKLNPNVINQIVIGCKMNEENIDAITTMSKKYLGELIPIYKTKMSLENFELDLIKIN